jgi:hypothetical protein
MRICSTSRNEPVRLLVGAMDLDTLWSHQEVRPDLSEAAAALRILASGVPLELSAAGRSVCDRLAADIRLYLRSP